MKEMTVLVTMVCKENQAKLFLSEIQNLHIQDKILQEEGCIQYEYFTSVKNPDVILLKERWESSRHQQVHMSQPHMKVLMEIQEQYVMDTVLEVFE